MRIAIDIEANSLNNPSKIWVIVCKDLDTGELHVFKELQTASGELTEEAQRFLGFATQVSYWVGHNWLEYDYPVLHRLLGLEVPDVADVSLDTLIMSRLANYSRGGIPVGIPDGEEEPRFTSGHSIESYGEEFGYPKLKFNDWTKYSKEMEDYCVRDVEICFRIYDKYSRYIRDPDWTDSILLEHRFQLVVNNLHENGFAFNSDRATRLLTRVTKDLAELDAKILEAFQPKETLIRSFTPKLTKFGTISRTSVPRSLWVNISDYEAGQTYQHTRLVPFNPASHKQIIDVLHDAGWKPIDKTKTHIELDRTIGASRRVNEVNKDKDVDKQEKLRKYGWKINENNLGTLPPGAPSGSRFLAKRILLESRRRSLTEWLGLVGTDSRIHGKFVGIGTWTHRMAHQRPNTANIPNELDINGSKKLLGKEMRALWQAPKNRLLVGVDAEGIQLRIFAHYIDDKEFTHALVSGKKAEKTDPHSLNQKILGSVCKSRAAAKRFIYALLLGAGMWKLSQILECSELETQEALSRLLRRYQGWANLKENDIPRDAKRGYFIGLDGRKISIPGEKVGERRHLAMSGYLQNGEAIIMKRATLKWMKEVEDAYEKRFENFSSLKTIQATIGKSEVRIVNLVHDEWQTETPNDMAKALWVAKAQSRALREVGEDLKLKCPLAGSYYNDDLKDYTIGTNWSVTH